MSTPELRLSAAPTARALESAVARAAFEDGDAVCWDPADAEGGHPRVRVLGAGAALELRGAPSQVRDAAQRVGPSIQRSSGFARGRFFGGFAFDPEHPSGAAWEPFGAGRFVLPRWSYWDDGEGAVLQLALGPEEQDAPLRAQLEARFQRAAEEPRRVPGTRAPGDPARWARQVRAALAAFEAGSLQKVVLARATTLFAQSALAPELAWRALQGRATVARFALGAGASVFLGASPERLLALHAGAVHSDALAGSLPRRGADEAERAALRASEKDRREHEWVLRALREHLEPFCERVEHPSAPEVRSVPSVHHLWTPVRAQLRGPTHALALLEALHPTPAVCGWPREAAARWIREQEPEGRGWYAGPVGWFDLEGEGSFAVALRSALLRGPDATLYAGAGLVRGSDPEREFEETEAKLRVMLEALGAGR